MLVTLSVNIHAEIYSVTVKETHNVKWLSPEQNAILLQCVDHVKAVTLPFRVGFKHKTHLPQGLQSLYAIFRDHGGMAG
jgi:hypothetical protein